MKNITTLLMIMVMAFASKAQDVITKKNGDDIKAKVLEVGVSEVKYKKQESENGATYTILKSDILMIRYKDGTKDIFNEVKLLDSAKSAAFEGDQGSRDNSKHKPKRWRDDDDDGSTRTQQPTLNTYNSNVGLNMYDRGRNDADLYYRGFSGAKIGTLVVAGIVSPLGGLIPAIICSSTPPQEFNLTGPNSELMSNSDYHNAYKMEAYRIKKRKTWTGWAIGSAIAILVYSIAASSAN